MKLKKGDTLALKIIIANTILKEWEKVKYDLSPRGFYWRGIFRSKVTGLIIDATMSKTSKGRNIGKITSVRLFWGKDNAFGAGKVLTIGDITPLVQEFKNNNFR